MLYGHTVTAAPSGKLIDTADLQRHCGIAVSDGTWDDMLDAFCAAAVDLYEQETGHHLLERTADYTIDQPPVSESVKLYLPHWPVSSIGAIQYVDGDQVTQTATTGDFIRTTNRTPASVSLKETATWPTTADQADALTIKDVVTGYSDVADVPDAIRQSILLVTGHWFENRETVVIGTITATVPMAAEYIWQRFKIAAGGLKITGV